jgi:hypothetical protein
MKPWLTAALAGASILCAVHAGEPAAPSAKFDLCEALNNRILGPRSPDRPLPLLAGDPAKGLRPACTVPWSALSPASQPLDVLSCFQGSLLQIENNSACGGGTGYLWINSRWVRTSAEERHAEERQRTAPRQQGAAQQPGADKPLAMCQELETKAVAATRDIPLDCEPRKNAAAADAAPARSSSAPANQSPAATPPK